MCETRQNMELFRKERDFPVPSYSANLLGPDALHFEGSCWWSPAADEHLWVALHPPALKTQAVGDP